MNEVWGAWGATKSRPTGLQSTSSLPGASAAVKSWSTTSSTTTSSTAPSTTGLTAVAVSPTATLQIQPALAPGAGGGQVGRHRGGGAGGGPAGGGGAGGGLNLNAMSCYELEALQRAIPRAQAKLGCRPDGGGLGAFLAGFGIPGKRLRTPKNGRMPFALESFGYGCPQRDGQYLGPCEGQVVHGTSYGTYGGVQFVNLGLNQGTWSDNDLWAGYGAPSRRRRRRRQQDDEAGNQRRGARARMSCDTIERRIARLQRMLAQRCGEGGDEVDEDLGAVIAASMPAVNYGAVMSAAGILAAAKATPGALVAASGPFAPIAAGVVGAGVGVGALAKHLAPIKTCEAKRRKAQAFAQAAQRATGKAKKALQRKAAKYAKQAAKVCPRAEAKIARRASRRGVPDEAALDAALGLEGSDAGVLDDATRDDAAFDASYAPASSGMPSTGVLLAGGAIVAVIAALALSKGK